MTALAAPRALTTELGLGSIQFGIADNVVLFPGALAAVNASGFAQPATTSLAINIAGVYTGISDAPVSNTYGIGTADNTGAGHAAGAFNVALSQGCFNFNMGSGGDVVTIANIGSMMFAIDDATVGLTDGGGTRSPCGVLVNVVGTQAFVSVNMINTRFAFSVANGIITTTNQTFVTGNKTFAAAAQPFFNNAADTFHVTFASAVTANRTFTFPDTASDTFVMLAATQTLTNKTLTAPVLGGVIAPLGTATFVPSAGVGGMDLHLWTGAAESQTSTTNFYKWNQRQSAGASANLIADPGTGQAIPVTSNGVCAITTGAGAETNTLAIPAFVGQVLTVCLDTAGGGTRTVTAASAINVAGNTTFALVTARQSITLRGIALGGTRCWEITSNIGTVVLG